MDAIVCIPIPILEYVPINADHTTDVPWMNTRPLNIVTQNVMSVMLNPIEFSVKAAWPIATIAAGSGTPKRNITTNATTGGCGDGQRYIIDSEGYSGFNPRVGG